MSIESSRIDDKSMPGSDIVLDARSSALRQIIVRMLEAGGRGHVGSAFSLGKT